MELQYNTRSLLHVFFRHKYKFVLVCALIIAAGTWHISKMEPYYQSSASLLIKFGQNARPEVNLPGNQSVQSYSYNDRREIIQSNAEILQSPDLLGEAIRTYGLKKLYPDMDVSDMDAQTALRRAVGRVQGDLTVDVSTDSHIIGVIFKSAQAETAASFNQQLVNTFRKRHTEIYDTPQISFLDEQAEKAKQRLAGSRQEFVEFKEEMGISEIDEEIQQLLSQKNDLSTVAYQSVTQAQQTLSELQAELAEMRATYREDSPMIRRLKESIATARAQVQARESNMGGGNVSGGSLPQKVKEINERITWLEAQRGRFNELEQQVRLDEENYQYYRQRSEEAEVNNMLNSQNITRITTINDPSVPLSPAGPQTKLMMLAVIILGLMAGLAIVVIYEVMDDRISYPEQINSYLDLPVLATFKKTRGL